MKPLAACLLSLAGVTLVIAAASATAAVYRCPDGSFQDKPCDKGDGKVVTKRNTAGKPKPPEDACIAYGQDAAEVAKARAGGATSAQLIADIDKSDAPYAARLARKKLVVDVFQKTGTPQEVGIAFEADCARARDQAGKTPAPSTAKEPAAAVGDPNAEAQAQRQREQQRRASEEAKRSACENLLAQRESVVASQRAGGSITTMESLNRNRAAIDKQLAQAGCN
jgi:hypothetical protein